LSSVFLSECRCSGRSIGLADPQGVDGIFGPKTREAIRSWQRDVGLESTGYLKQGTYEQLITAVRQQPSAQLELPPVQNIHGWSAERVKALQRRTAEALDQPVVFQDRLGDGSRGPEMVIVPTGEFLMGSPESEEGWYDNEEQHSVQIKRPFALGKHEVTVGEFRRFVKTTGYQTDAEKEGGCYVWSGEKWVREKKTWRNPGYEQDESHPVVCVSWDDAMAYIEWLS
jgi:formylglycine-generating enzyme required for sulfatase activity